MTQKTYQETGLGLSYGVIQELLPSLKQEHEWLKEPYSQCLQVVALNLSNAFINFFEDSPLYDSAIFYGVDNDELHLPFNFEFTFSPWYPNTSRLTIQVYL